MGARICDAHVRRLHLRSRAATRLHACLSQCFLRMAADAPDGSERDELLHNAAAHGDALAADEEADASELMAAAQAAICVKQLERVERIALRLKRMALVSVDEVQALRDICQEGGLRSAAYYLSCVVLSQLQRQCTQPADAAAVTSVTPSARSALLSAHAGVLMAGLRLLGPDHWQNAPNLARLLPACLMHAGVAPMATDAGAQTAGLNALMGYVQILPGSLVDSTALDQVRNLTCSNKLC